MRDLISIIVDDREPQSIVDTLQKLPECKVTKKRLLLGDYLIDERLLFERKTLPDFITSVKDGRLFEQAMRLAASKYRACIVLEGRVKNIEQSGMSRESLQGALVSVSLMFGIPLLRSFDVDETAHLMLYAAKQLRNVANGAIARKGKRPKNKRRIQLNILQELPGIGPSRAQALLDRFGSITNVMQAEYEELVEMDGIGPQTAERIQWAANEEVVHYVVHSST